MIDLSFSFRGQCWLWQSESAAWHFIHLPPEKSEEIKFFNENVSVKKRGWGAVRVQVTIGETIWDTSIFPHKESNTYILPIKAEVRKAENIKIGDEITVKLKILI
ncbi:MAG: DUF1905 domain-containing protein [Methylophilaceae bacterium]